MQNAKLGYIFLKKVLDFLYSYGIIKLAHTIYCVVNISKIAYFGGLRI